ncbi:vacuolar protein-sorting-associated protein 25-like isoform X1 [Oncorhynchus nerka]|uniref:vacuolar protein-sorting-associated protein 25-like isoform X1 n=2 Tax=Oncorhynchus nerka TaxID=8023 RepID=UPI0031B8A8A6
MSFEWPWQYNFPPFFTLQPNVDTRQKQLAAWCSLALSYCRHHKLYTLDIMEVQECPVFNHKNIDRKLSTEAILIVFEELRKKGNLEWLDKNKTQCLVMWRRPEEWGKLIYQWVSKNGMVNTVFTLYELANGDDTESEGIQTLSRRTTISAALHQSGLYGRVARQKPLLSKMHIARLEFVKRHLKDSDHEKQYSLVC